MSGGSRVRVGKYNICGKIHIIFTKVEMQQNNPPTQIEKNKVHPVSPMMVDQAHCVGMVDGQEQTMIAAMADVAHGFEGGNVSNIRYIKI